MHDCIHVIKRSPVSIPGRVSDEVMCHHDNEGGGGTTERGSESRRELEGKRREKKKRKARTNHERVHGREEVKLIYTYIYIFVPIYTISSRS